jgi:hypothetical protein
MARAGYIVAGVLLLFLGLIFIASILLAVVGVLFVIIGLILLIAGAVLPSQNAPQVVVVQQPVPAYYAPGPGQPQYYPPPPQPPVTVNVHQAAPPPPPPQVMYRCRFCNTVYPETKGKCPACGASF